MSTKRKIPQRLGQPVVKQNAKVIGKGNLDESKTVVSGGGAMIKSGLDGVKEVVEISSDSEEGQDEDKSDNESVEEQDEAASTAGGEAMDITGQDAPLAEDVEESGELSFGDLVRANGFEPIDVAGAFEDPSSRALTCPQGTQQQPPSGASLGTVLTQALKTNDVSLLESCFHTTDVNTIRATIQRLDSPLAATLLQKLAERLHRRPGRAGSLMVWVQWALVAHGGYLATQRDLMKKLAGLNRVIDDRAKGLQTLLSLKGKLDMLEAQMELRRSMQEQRRRIDEDEDDDAVIYVEGEDGEAEAEGTAKPKRLASNGGLVDISDGGSDVSEDMPTTNGVIADSEEEEESSGDDLIDDEAEETDADSGDEDEVDHDDQDSQDEDDESDDGNQALAPPTKMQRIGSMFSRKR